ncbi:MAG: hypothetical protein BWY09_01816 [Candidatus Hydrogenedentes bacterium ADurb.Bin179]|nr:MAG: hypothetical protein BWY09_01816 [Candidatus Hydrogenedentes bacterium ADurb.Bin179]
MAPFWCFLGCNENSYSSFLLRFCPLCIRHMPVGHESRVQFLCRIGFCIRATGVMDPSNPQGLCQGSFYTGIDFFTGNYGSRKARCPRLPHDCPARRFTFGDWNGLQTGYDGFPACEPFLSDGWQGPRYGAPCCNTSRCGCSAHRPVFRFRPTCS